MMKRVFVLLFLILLILNSPVFGEDMADVEAEAYHEKYEYYYPEIKPEFFGFTGYRLVNLRGYPSAGEFEYLHNSILLGGEIRAFPFPHRLHFEADIVNKKDYFMDVSYAYKDIVLFRDVHRALFHNLDNIILRSGSNILTPPPFTPAYWAFDERSDRYGARVDINNLFLRLKTPDFPAHLYIDGRFINKNGNIQQRFMGGSGYFNSNVRISQKRDIDWDTQEIVVGANSHIGPVEVDISHTEKRFRSENDRIFSFAYSATSIPPGRLAGTYPHNLVPNLDGSTNTIKLHTSYTGSLVAAATLSWADRKNIDSRATAEYVNGAVEVTYVPHSLVTFVARYKHRETDLDNPSSLPVGYLGYSSYISSLTGIRHSLSSDTDTFTGIVRYRPFSGVGMTAEYTYETIDRNRADEWEIPDSTIKKRFIFSVAARILKNLKVKAKYTHHDINSPAHNSVPDESDQGDVSVTWSPFSWANTLLSYSIAKEDRDHINYVHPSTGTHTTEALNRDVNREKILANITLLPLKNLSITPSFAYFKTKTEQDLIYHDTGNNDQVDKNVPYREIAHSYSAAVNYAPVKNMNVFADASYTKGRGGFSPGIPFVDIAYLSDFRLRETVYSIGGDYTLKGSWTIGARYKYNSFKDQLVNSYDDSRNGIVSIILLTVSKKW